MIPIKNLFEKGGSRLIANHIKLRQTKNGQFIATIPISIIRSAGLEKGSVLYFKRVNPITREITIEPRPENDE